MLGRCLIFHHLDCWQVWNRSWGASAPGFWILFRGTTASLATECEEQASISYHCRGPVVQAGTTIRANLRLWPLQGRTALRWLRCPGLLKALSLSLAETWAKDAGGQCSPLSLLPCGRREALSREADCSGAAGAQGSKSFPSAWALYLCEVQEGGSHLEGKVSAPPLGHSTPGELHSSCVKTRLQVRASPYVAERAWPA